MPEPTMGWHTLLFGWLGPLGLQGLVGDVPDRAYPVECAALLPPLDLGRYRETSTAMFSWFANPLWWLCIWKTSRGRGLPAVSFSIAAVLALLALQPHETWFDHTIAAQTPAIGAYLWAISIWMLLLIPLPRLTLPTLRRSGQSLV